MVGRSDLNLGDASSRDARKVQQRRYSDHCGGLVVYGLFETSEQAVEPLPSCLHGRCFTSVIINWRYL